MAAIVGRRTAALVMGIALLAATGCNCCHKRHSAPCPAPAGGCCPDAGPPIGGPPIGGLPIGGPPPMTPLAPVGPGAPPPTTNFSLTPSPGCCGSTLP